MKDEENTKNRILKLRNEISRLRKEYHINNNPKVTDDVYESLTRELKQLEDKYPQYKDPNSDIFRVAGAPLPSFKKVKHEIRMLSLNDVFSEKEMIDWENRVEKLIDKNKKVNYFCEVKLDGLSASLFYEDGIFVRGATRGDGFIGEDVTENLKMIRTIPLYLKGDIKGKIEIRGEVVMTKKAWQSLNNQQQILGKQTFANTRNAAAGSLRQLDSSVVKDRKLDFFAWDIAQSNMPGYTERIKNHSDKHKLLHELGFEVSPYEKKVKDIKEIFSFIDEVAKVRQGLPYGTDGIVVSVDDLEIQENLGYVGKAPRYMVAYKYEAERSTTIVSDITVNVGRTGVLTPVAHFKPTLVAGSTVSKATLHNIDQINRLDIRIGDTIVIQKAGDVIPEVVEVLVKMRTGKEKKFKMPEYCPICESKVSQRALSEKDKSDIVSVAFYCVNPSCPARNRRGLQHFVNVFEIYEIGPKILDRLKDEGLISDAADLFTLERADLSGLERFGEKSAENIISSIKSHTKVLLWRFIYALGILHTGEQTAQDIASHFGSLKKVMNASIDDINKIENIGPVVSKSIYEFFHNKENLIFIEKLINSGVVIDNKSTQKGSKLKDKIFVLTGTLSSLAREDAKKMIINQGGRIASSVSKKTNYVVVGKDPGTKYEEALSLGIKILNEKELLEMVSI